MTNASFARYRPARITQVTRDDVDRVIEEIEQIRAQTFRHPLDKIDDRVKAIIRRTDRMIALADDELVPRLRSARTLLHCLHMGVTAAA